MCIFGYLHTTVSLKSSFTGIARYNSPVSIQNECFFLIPTIYVKDFVAHKGKNLFYERALKYLKPKSDKFENLITCNLSLVSSNGANDRSIE